MKKRQMFSFVGGLAVVIPAAVSAGQLEEVVVTATKRTTNLQDTPLAISAFGQETLTENHVTDVYDLRGMVPSLQIRSNGDHNVPLIFIRGQGTIDQTEAGDGAVAFYTDGIFAARAQGSLALMYDVDRVEVLRGPQGTLFGRNSTAGAVAIHAAKPKDTFEASGQLTWGSRDKQTTEMMLNAPVTDTWALRFAAIQDQQEGATDFPRANAFQTQRNYGTVDASSFRISSLLTPTDSLEWYLSYEEYKNNGTGDVPSEDYDARFNNATSPGNIDLKSQNIRTRLDYTLPNDMMISYIGGYTEFSQSQVYGSEHQGDIRDTVWSTHEATQHEIQVKNSDDARFRWTGGVFFFQEENGIRFDIPHGSWGFTPQDQPTVLSTFVQPERTLDSFSAYFQGTFDITEAVRLTAGIRHTSDEREDIGGRSIDCTYDPGRGPLPPRAIAAAALNGAQGCWDRQVNDMQDEWDNETYLIRAEWDLNDDIMLFVSYATGWKSGVLADGQGTRVDVGADGIFGNADDGTGPDGVANSGDEIDEHSTRNIDYAGNNQIPQQPEENDSFEIGVKSTLLDGSMTLNANLFFMTYEDMQVTAAVTNPVTGQSTLTKTNAGEASMEGIEVEMQYSVGEGGLLVANATYLQAEYDEFLGPDNTFGDYRGRLWNDCGIGVEADGSCTDGVFNFSGNTLPNAPELAIAVSYKHDITLGNGATLTPRIRLQYTDDMFLTQENRDTRPACTADNLGIAWFNNPASVDPATCTDPGEDNSEVQEAHVKVDLSLGYTSSDERWGAELYMNNATDEEIKAESGGRASSARTRYVWGPQRESGLRVNFKFD